MRQSSDGDEITDRIGDSIEGMTRSQRSNRRAARHQLLHLGHRCRTMDALRAEGDVAGPIGGQWSHLFACSGWTHLRSNVAGLLHTSTPAWVITPRTASCARLVDRAGGRRQSPGSGTAPGYPCIEPVPLGHRGGSVPARAGSGRMVRLRVQAAWSGCMVRAAWSGSVVRPHGHRGRFGLDRGRPPVVMHPPGFDTAPAIGSAPGCPTISPTPGSRSARPHSTTEKETCCDGYP